MHLFFREKQLDNAGPTSPANGVAAICAFSSFLLLFLMPYLSFAKPAFLFLISVYLFSNLKWLNFMRKEAGLMFAVKALPLNYILGIEIMGSAVYAALAYPFSDKDIIPG